MNVANLHNATAWFQVLQTTERSQTAVMTLSAGGQSSEEPGIHPHSDQILFVDEGHVIAEIAGQKRQLHPGDICVVPAGTRHRFENAGQERAVTFNVYTPPAYPANERG